MKSNFQDFKILKELLKTSQKKDCLNLQIIQHILRQSF